MEISFNSEFIKFFERVLAKSLDKRGCEVEDNITYIPKSSINYIEVNLTNNHLITEYDVTVNFDSGNMKKFKITHDKLKELEQFCGFSEKES